MFFVFLCLFRLDFGWNPLQPEINQNTMLELRQVFNLKTTLVAFRLSPLQHEINQNTRLELCQVFNIKRNSKIIDVKVYIG